jgi:hypothetical protein
MKMLTLTLAALTTIVLMSLSVSPAKADGYGWYVSSRPVYKTSYYGYSARPIYVTSGYGASTIVVGDHHDHVWHDTSHLHYRPPTLRWHGNHFDYEPERYEVHHTGHWDHGHSDW